MYGYVILDVLIYALAYKVCIYKSPEATKDDLFTTTANALCTDIYSLYKELYPQTSGYISEDIKWELVN